MIYLKNPLCLAWKNREYKRNDIALAGMRQKQF